MSRTVGTGKMHHRLWILVGVAKLKTPERGMLQGSLFEESPEGGKKGVESSQLRFARGHLTVRSGHFSQRGGPLYRKR